MKRSVTKVLNALRSIAASYLRNPAGIRADTQSGATKRANENPTTLAAIVPAIDTANAVGHGQICGAASTNTVPGTPNGCSTVYATMNTKYPHAPHLTSARASRRGSDTSEKMPKRYASASTTRTSATSAYLTNLPAGTEAT